MRLAWLPDGSGLLIADSCSADGAWGLVRLNLPMGVRRCLVTPDAPGEQSYVGGLALSPEGALIALSGSGPKGCCDLFVVPRAEATPRPTVEFLDFATHHISPVFALDKQPLRWFPSLSATADGKTIYYTQWDRQSAIRMIEFAR